MNQPQTETEARKIEVTNVFTRNKNATSPVVLNEGGADSSKSYSLAQLFIYKFNNEKNKSFLVCRKTLPHLRITAYRLIINLMKDYGYYPKMVHNKSERTIFSQANNNLMLFTSIDDPEKIKSAEFNYIWMEEANEFTWSDYLILKLRMRAKTSDGEANRLYLSYNPVDEYGFINGQIKPQPDNEVIHSTVDDNPFAQDADIKVLDGLKGEDATYYRIYRLGLYAKIKGRIHELQTIKEFPECVETIYGLDFGFVHPNALLKIDIDLEGMNLYLSGLHHQTGQTNSQLIESLRKKIPEEHRAQEIYGDSAEPARIEEIYEARFNIRASDKSVLDGIDCVNRFTLYTKDIYVDVTSEVRGYKRKTDKNGNVLEDPVKFRDHYPNALRYAVYTHLKERLLELEPAWVVTAKSKAVDVKPLADIEVRDAAIKRIEESGFVQLGIFARNMAHTDSAMRVKLLAMGFKEHIQNRFVYGEALAMKAAELTKPKEKSDDDSWVV